MPQMVLGMFSERTEAEDAINELESLGYNPKDISIMMQDRGEARAVADNTGANVAGGAVSGATTGGALGAIAGLLVGIGAIAVPGIGALLIGGPLATALGLTGAAATTISGAATGAVAGGLIGALMGLGVPEEDARVYETGIRDGGILVAVPAFTGRTEEAQSVLTDFGATQVRTVDMNESREYGTTRGSYSEEYHQPVAYAESSKNSWFGDEEPVRTRRSSRRR